MMTKELAEVMTNEALLDRYADDYGMKVFVSGSYLSETDRNELKKSTTVLKEEILKRMTLDIF